MEPWAACGESPGFTQKLADTFCDHFSGKIGALPGISTAYIQGAPFEKQYGDFLHSPDLKPNGASHSLTRYARNWETRNGAICAGPSCGAPNARVGGASVRWLNQSCSASEQARGPAAARIQVPVLLLQGGQDIKVKPSAQAQFCTNLNKGTGPGYCVGRTMVGAEHSVLMESDEFRVPALVSAFRFYDCVESGKSRCE
jgi:lysophospholipase